MESSVTPSMADFTSSSSSSPSSTNAVLSVPSPVAAAASASASASAAASSSGAIDDAFEDSCSICLEPFSSADPATITSCNHEYHLQCILEWSQRSKECPICWRLLVLKDLTSQELLVAVETERASRARTRITSASASFHHFQEDYDTENDASYSDDSDFYERIVQHLAAAAAAASGAHNVRRRERHRSSGLRPSPDVSSSSPENVVNVQQINTSLPEICQNLSYRSIGRDSPIFGMTSSEDIQSQPYVASPVENVTTSTALDGSGTKSRILHRQPPPDQSQQPSPSEISSFSVSIKSKWSAASARYKESISKGTRGFKEKLLARNTSVKELSKGVQREISAGIAGVARMIDRLDLTPKQTASSFPASSCTGGTSNFLNRKGVPDNDNAQSLNKNGGELECDLSSDATSNVSCNIPGQVEVSLAKNGH